MSPAAKCKLIGRWRIVEADVWNRDYLDLGAPATITITDQGRGEIAFGAAKPGPISNTAGLLRLGYVGNPRHFAVNGYPPLEDTQHREGGRSWIS
jgi:hypothetical protein